MMGTPDSQSAAAVGKGMEMEAQNSNKNEFPKWNPSFIKFTGTIA